MRYPTINQYLETLADIHKMFRTLDSFSVCRDAYGEPVFVSGNYAVVFRIEYGGAEYALKCYTRATEHADRVYGYLEGVESQYLTTCRYLFEEIYVYDEYGKGCYFPVVVMPWIDAVPLGYEIERLCRKSSHEALASLAGKFDRMALWLLRQEFAHGDLKQDNILVCGDGSLKIIDYDGMYVPGLSGRHSSLVGSPAYQHPSRGASFFNVHIDDYSIALISVSLHALACDSSLYAVYNEGDNIVLNPAGIVSGDSPLLDRLESEWLDAGELELYAMCRMLRSPDPVLPHLERVLAALCGEPNILADDCRIIDDTDKDLSVICHNGKYGFMDAVSRHVKMEPLFGDAKPFSEGLAPVKIGSGWRFIDNSGQMVLDCSGYDTVEPFRELLALVSRKGLYGFIDKNGREVIPLQYEFARSFRGGFAKVRVGDSYEYIDREGNLEKNM